MPRITKEMEENLRKVAGYYSQGNDLKARQSLGGYESFLKRKNDFLNLNRVLDLKSALFGKKKGGLF